MTRLVSLTFGMILLFATGGSAQAQSGGLPPAADETTVLRLRVLEAERQALEARFLALGAKAQALQAEFLLAQDRLEQKDRDLRAALEAASMAAGVRLQDWELDLGTRQWSRRQPKEQR